MTKTQRGQLKLAIDFGGSSTKVIATAGDKSMAVVMSPEAIEVAADHLDDYRQQLGGDLLHRSFVGVGERYVAVGSLAQRLGATQALQRLKSQTAVYKVLAVVSILANRWHLGRRFALELGCLLPPGEFSDRVRLKQLLMDRDWERQHLVKTIESTQTIYWQAIQDWLADKLPTGIEEVMLSGGTADVLKADFVGYLQERLPNRPDCGDRPGIFNNRVFKLPELDVPAAYQSRMADVYCLFEYLMKSKTKTRSK